MKVLKIIFNNSIICKIFLCLLFIYKNSYTKIFCNKCYNIYISSYIYKMVQNYMNSTPLYKYSFIKKINENFYLLVVNYSKWLYNLVDKTVNNSFFINLIKNQTSIIKKNKLGTYSKMFSAFFFSYYIASEFLNQSNMISYISFGLGLFFVIIYLTSNALKRIFANSFIFNFSKKLLAMEVQNEKQ